MLRRLLLAPLLVAAAVNPPAHALTAEVCVRDVTLTFDTQIGVLRLWDGRVTRDQVTTCVRWDGGVPYTVQFHAVSYGTYVGDCTLVQIAGEFSMKIVAGGVAAAGALYAFSLDGGYNVVDALVLVPDSSCGFTTLTGVEAGPGISGV